MRKPERLTVLYRNMYAVQTNMIHLNVATAPDTRIVTIDLTPEQQAALTPRIVGRSGPDNRPIHEEWESICLSGETEEETE